MPDTGNYDHDNSDQTAPANWAGAFAALPPESPTPDGWQRLQARLPVASPTRTRTRTRWPLWLATAASLALMIAMPLRMQTTTSAIPVVAPSPSVTTPSAHATTTPAIDPGIEVASQPVSRVPIESTGSVASTSIPETTARTRKPRRGQHVDPSQRPIRTVAQPADTTRIANGEKPDSPASTATLESLYAQSARLESVLAIARDERVSTGTAAALTDTLNAQVASIDAALIQPDVSLQGRTDLWSERIETLRQLVGIETTQRLYSARGQQYEAAMVSID